MGACKTASTCSPDEAQGMHAFHVLGYSKHKGMGKDPDSFIRSRIFTVGGHDWAIRLYPDGYGSNSIEASVWEGDTNRTSVLEGLNVSLSIESFDGNVIT